MAFSELSITSNFTFLTGGSHPEEYARRATELGLDAFAIADWNSVAGIVRAHTELKLIREEIEEARAYAEGEKSGASTLAFSFAPDTDGPAPASGCPYRYKLKGLKLSRFPETGKDGGGSAGF